MRSLGVLDFLRHVDGEALSAHKAALEYVDELGRSAVDLLKRQRDAFATKKLNLNADLGEGFGPWRLTDDAALMELVTSANVACGGHAGDDARGVAGAPRLHV